MPNITINNFNTYYELHGNREKTLVFISGLMCYQLLFFGVGAKHER